MTSPVRESSSRVFISQPITIRELPNSRTLSSGPGLSPPPPIRFRTLPRFSHLRAQSIPSLTKTSPHRSNLSLPIIIVTSSIEDGSRELRDCDHRDLSLCDVGCTGLCNIRNPNESQSIREGRKRRRGRRGITPFIPFPPGGLQETNLFKSGRTISGEIRHQDEQDTWF